MTIEEAIRHHKRAVRRVGRGAPYDVPEEVQELYKAIYLENKYGYDALDDEDKALLDKARAENGN